MGVLEEKARIDKVEKLLREEEVLALLSKITEAAIAYADHSDAEEADHGWNAKHPMDQRSTTRDRRIAAEKLQEIRKLVRELHNL